MLGSVHGVVVDFAELSDPGRDPSKQVNEDSAGYAETPLGHLAVVCDGMGGHEAGREASQLAVRTIIEATRAHTPGVPAGLALKQAVERAGRAVYALGGSGASEHRPGSTCVAVLLHPGGAELCHAGDSRAYLIRDGHIQRVTRDHSMVQELVASGMLTPEQALAHPEANKITRALGIAPEVSVEARAEPLGLLRGDVLLLSSDGLTDLVTDPEILDIVRRRLPSGTAAVCQELVGLANSRGGHDNVTVLVLALVELPPQTAARGTVIQDALPMRGATLVEGDQGTLSDGAPAPTLFDDGSAGPRPTLPGLTQLDTGDRRTQPDLATPSFPHEEPPPHLLRPRPISSSRALVWLGVGLAVTVLAAVAAWALVRAMHRGRDRSEEIVPPPEVKLPPRPSSSAPREDAEMPAPSPSGAPQESADAARD